MPKFISIWNAVLVQASVLNLQPGVQLTALNSGELDNETGSTYNSLRVNLLYDQLTPDPGGSPSFSLGAIVEAKDTVTGQFNPIAYQFNPFRASNTGKQRIIIVQPDMDTFNLGIDDVIFPLNEPVARISREHGIMKTGKFRVRILFIDNNPLGLNGFVSVRITGEAELYNV